MALPRIFADNWVALVVDWTSFSFELLFFGSTPENHDVPQAPDLARDRTIPAAKTKHHHANWFA